MRRTKRGRRRQFFREGRGRGNYIGCPGDCRFERFEGDMIRSQAAESETWIYFAKFLKFKIAFYAKETTYLRIFKFEHDNRNDTI